MSRKLHWLSRFAGTCHAKFENIVVLFVFFLTRVFNKRIYTALRSLIISKSAFAQLLWLGIMQFYTSLFSFFPSQYCTKLEATRHTDLTVFLVRKPVVKRNLEINLMLIIASGSISACQSIKTTIKQIQVPNPLLIIAT